ncbi:hypothetical protein D3C73_1512910 [compost metagenome]
MLDGERLDMDKAQACHGADAIQHVPVQAAPLAMLILEQVPRVIQRRHLHWRVFGDPLQLLGIQRDAHTRDRLRRSRISRGHATQYTAQRTEQKQPVCRWP